MSKKTTDEGGGNGKSGYSTLNDVKLPPPPTFGPSWDQLSFAQQTQLLQPANNEKWRERPGNRQQGYDYSANPRFVPGDRQAGTFPPNGGAGGAGGAGAGGPDASSLNAGPGPITWSVKYGVAGAPAWWKGLVPDRLDPNSEYMMLMNALVPFMSPEDQRTAASNLSRTAQQSGAIGGELWNGYDPTQPVGAAGWTPPAFGPIPNQVTGDIRNQFTGQARANQVLSTLDQIAQVMGKSQSDFGPGYGFLRDLAATERDFGGTQAAPQTRRQYLQEQSALDPLMAETKGASLSPYGPAAQAFADPFFSGGPLRNYSKTQAGKVSFGTPNSKLY